MCPCTQLSDNCLVTLVPMPGVVSRQFVPVGQYLLFTFQVGPREF